MKRFLIIVTIMGGISFVPVVAWGIVSLVPALHSMDSSEVEVDTSPPGSIPLATFNVIRGSEESTTGTGGCGGVLSEPVAEVGEITLFVTPPEDDRTPPDKIGYRFELVGGTPPSGFEVPPETYAATPDGVLSLGWIDGTSEEQEPFVMSLGITPVDLAWNEGPTYVLVVSDDGCCDK